MKNNSLRLSIVIPVFNLSDYIERTLQSLVNQQSHDYELIIVDDGSTDDSLIIIKDYLNKQDYINNYKIIETTNKGVASARNKGLLNSSGDYIYFLDGDDTVYPSFITTLHEVLEKYSLENLDAISFGFDRINFDDSKFFFRHRYNLKTGIYKNNSLLNLFLQKKISISTQNIIYKKSFLEFNEIKYENYKQAQDVHFIIRCLVKIRNSYHINESLAVYHRRLGSTTSSLDFKKFDSVQAKIDLLNWNKGKPYRKSKKLENYIQRYMYNSFFLIFRTFIRNEYSRKDINSAINEFYPQMYRQISDHLAFYKVLKITNIILARNNIVFKYGLYDLRVLVFSYLLRLKSFLK